MAARLRLAREAAGFPTIRDAVERFGLNYATYAGHENGHRGMKPDVLRDYARHFRVNIGWLINGTGEGPGAVIEAITPPPGMAEAELLPLTGPATGRAGKIAGLAEILAPAARHVVAYRAQRAFPAFAVLKGDVLLIGTPPETRDGDLVIATLTDMDTGAAVTVLRQRMGEKLVPPVQGGLENEAAMTPGILGTVVATIRAPLART